MEKKKNKKGNRPVPTAVSEEGSESEEQDNRMPSLSPTKKAKHDVRVVGLSITPFVGFMGDGGNSQGLLVQSLRIQTLTYPYSPDI